MTKKHYESIAAIIARIYRDERLAHENGDSEDDTGERAIGRVADELARYMAGDNPRFNRARFLAACGVEA